MSNTQSEHASGASAHANLLQGKIAVITGAASGIGRATAIIFAQQGAQVFCCDIDDGGGQQTIASIRANGGNAAFHHADVTSTQDLESFTEFCAQRTDRIDILFNNAGRLIRQRVETTTDDDWDAMLAVNLTSVFRCSRRFLTLLKESKTASIINHASIDASFGNPSLAAYSASKGGLIPLTHVMAHDLAQYGIRVNAISSGGIATAMSANREAATARRDALTPLQRSGRPEEVANVALFLASDWSSYVNGTNVIVDGGRTAITQGCF